jgi:hypothetical protein
MEAARGSVKGASGFSWSLGLLSLSISGVVVVVVGVVVVVVAVVVVGGVVA